jgi:hypothetical protein
MNGEKSINCFLCVHFYVTWDNARPRGCRAMGFKSREIPSLVVLKSSGSPCLHYEEKKEGRRSES